jgi:hypothetical protein
VTPLGDGSNALVGRKIQRLAGDRARLVDLLLLCVGGGHRQLDDRAGLEVAWVLGCERGIEDRLGGVGLAEGDQAGALVVADVEPVVSEVHAVSAFVGLGSVHGIVGQNLRLTERRCVAKASMGACLQRRQPCLDGHICTPASVALSPPDEFERRGVVAAIGRDEASPSQQPSCQRFVLSFDGRLQRRLVPDVGGCRVPQVEGQPCSKPS